MPAWLYDVYSCVCVSVSKVKFTSAVKMSESGAVGPEFARDEEENFFKRLGKWRSGRRNPSKLHHTEEKDGRPPPPRGAPLAHPRPIVLIVYFSLSFCPCLCMSVWCRVLSRKWWSASSSVRHPPCQLDQTAACYILLAWMYYTQPISVSFVRNTPFRTDWHNYGSPWGKMWSIF